MCRRLVGMAQLVLALAAVAALAGGMDEFKIKRQEVFEFTEKPTIKRENDRIAIHFASKALCDVTVAVEDSAQPNARIVRHLASGVLGPTAPAPFQKDSLAQTITWDSKDDRGDYVADISKLTVRVSLGLQPRLERTLYWSPYKRAAQSLGKTVAFRATPEGVYVFDSGQAVDHVRLFSHAGQYVKTIYPFPADKIKDVAGLIWHEFPQDGQRLPIKPSYQMCTLLTSGDNALNINFKDGRYFAAPMDPGTHGKFTQGSTDIAIAGDRIALAADRLNRLATDGGSPKAHGPAGGGPAGAAIPVYGPNVDLRNPNGFYKATESFLAHTLGGYGLLTNLRPHRFTLSPDGKWVYLTRYIENYALDTYVHNYWQHGVYRMAYEGDAEPELFLGAVDRGSDDRHFSMPTDVACDAAGRLYVADYGNSRVQVFKPDGTLVKSIAVDGPAQLAVSPKTGEFYVFSWPIMGNKDVVPPKLGRPFVVRKFKSADDPKLLATYDLPIAETAGKYEQYATVDFWADGPGADGQPGQPGQGGPTIWVSPGRLPITPGSERGSRPAGILVLAEKPAGLELLCDFQRQAEQAVVQAEAPGDNRQRLFFDPKREMLYVGEGPFYFGTAMAIDPASGKTRLVELPFDAEDMCFDIAGQAYLRTPGLVARYDPGSWREVPWDYGEEREHVTYNCNSGRREAKVVSGLAMPVNAGWHHGGMSVSPKGDMAVGCLYLFGPPEKNGPAGQPPLPAGTPYTPRIYPGRITRAAYGCEYVHVWDKHGRILYEDAVQGLGTVNGVGIDNQDNLYVLSAAPRVYDGKPYFNFLAGTLMKFPAQSPAKGRIVSDSGNPNAAIPLSPENRPKRPPDLTNLPGDAWVEGADWLYGGVGWHGKNHGLGCGCRNTRFGLDYFGRSFAPEIDRYSVAVLDTAGNVILRIGHYGNVDDGTPLVAAGGPANPRSIGGDEVSLMHGAYVATQSDRRVFIADIGNYRVVSVKLDYHATERAPLSGSGQ